MAARTRGVSPWLSDSGGTHSSSTMAMSDPKVSWTLTARSGLSVLRLPSRGDAKVTPCSSTRARSARDQIWKPPESVSQGPRQPENPWSPPNLAITSSPGAS